MEEYKHTHTQTHTHTQKHTHTHTHTHDIINYLKMFTRAYNFKINKITKSFNIY